MVRRNKRDAKFLIFQSLYIIAISILFFKGTDLSLTKVEVIEPGKIRIDSNLKPYNPVTEIILTKPADSARYQLVLLKDTIVTKEDLSVTKETLAQKDKRISELEAQKTPERKEQSIKEKTNTPPNPIKGGRNK
jgi:hypothetical protein